MVNPKTRPRLAIVRVDFICRLCNITWSMFTQTNNLCTNSPFRDGIHNFDFRKPTKYSRNITRSKIV